MYYFAYGSNINRKQMLECSADSEPMFVATLPNYKLVFVGWSRQWLGGVASIKPFRGEKVIGAIYDISEGDLRRLDAYEGYPRSSVRQNIKVFDEDGELIQAVTHIRAVQSEETRPSEEYLAVIQQGYRDWRII
ncbi:gamma-glutamylcyclotransferase family protein [Chloroflexota bacterium]